MKPICVPALASVIALLGAAACSDQGAETGEPSGDHVVHWGYDEGVGPAVWGTMDPEWILCAEGLSQSPIDLVNATQVALPRVVIDTPSENEVAVLNQAGVINALDNGHTIQINTKSGESMTVGDKTYGLVQFHFHAPSEHTVDGVHFPMEMHFVHQAEDGALAVLGVFVEEGEENLCVAPLWKQLSEAPGSETTIRVPARFAENMFPEVGSGVYHYDGSLTTPPCSEGVKWFIRITPTQLSSKQIADFTAVYDHNNRPLQAANDRAVRVDTHPNLTVR